MNELNNVRFGFPVFKSKEYLLAEHVINNIVRERYQNVSEFELKKIFLYIFKLIEILIK